MRNLKYWVFFNNVGCQRDRVLLEGGSKKGRVDFQFSKAGQGAPPILLAIPLKPFCVLFVCTFVLSWPITI